MDGLELAALNNFNDAHGKLLSQYLGRKLKLLVEGMGLGSPDCISDLPALRHLQVHRPAGQQGSDFIAFDADIR